jgi:hypothetical protein
MKCRKKLPLFALSLCIAIISNAQYQPKYFGDSITPIFPYQMYGTQALGNAFYMFALTRSAQGNVLNTVIKTDTSGNHLWTAYPYNYAHNDSLQFNGIRGSFQLISGSDSALYLLNACDSPFYFNSPGNIEHISKIDNNTGEVKWVKKLTDYDLDDRYLRIADYSATELFLSSYRNSNGKYSIVKILKSTGQTSGTQTFATGPANFDLPDGYSGTTGPTTQLYRSPNNNLFIFTSDSCYKFTSYDNNTLEWKIKFTYPYGAIQTAFEDNGLLYVCGNDRLFYDFGLIAAIDLATGNTAWQNRQGIQGQGVDGLEFCDAKIKNNHLYTTWRHSGAGSIEEKCFIACANKSNGNIIWNTNFSFNSDTTTGGSPEAMLSLAVDDNETLFLTGYVPNPTYQTYDWGIMKINGITGQLISKKRIPKLLNAYVEDKGVLVKQYGNNLYLAGYRTKSTTNFDDRAINLLRADTAGVNIASIKTITGQMQYPSVTRGIRDFSVTKKLVVKNVGKSLIVEMTNNSLTPIWTKRLGNSTDYYQGTTAIGVNLAKRIFVATKRFKPVTLGTLWMTNEYHSQDYTKQNDSTIVFELDSAGVLLRSYNYGDFGRLTALRFVVDTPSTKTFFEYYTKNPNTTLNDNVSYYSFAQGDGTWGTGWAANPGGRTALLKPRYFYHLPGDTLIGFQTNIYTVGQVVKTRYLSGGQNTFSTIPSTKVIYDVEKTANNRYYIVGQDSLKRDFVMALNTYGVSQVWRNTFDTFQNTLKVLAIDTAVYTLTKRGKVYTVQCYGITNGNILWNNAIPVPANSVLSVNDFSVNKVQKTITVLGFTKDTTGNFHHSTCYAYTFTRTGTEHFRLAKDGNNMWMNEGTVLFVDRDNQTLAGGSIHFTPFGYAGFIMGADQAPGYYTVSNGDWNNPATWLGGVVPSPDAAVFISNNVTVTANATCYSMQVQQPGGIVNINPGVILTVTH